MQVCVCKCKYILRTCMRVCVRALCVCVCVHEREEMYSGNSNL